jgi:hypothetical protein
MKLVRIEVLPARDNEIVVATIIEQRREGGAWREIRRQKVRSDEVARERTMLLEDNERVIFEEPNERVIVDGLAQVETVIVPEERAAVPRMAVAELVPVAEPTLLAGPLPPGKECQIGVWRVAGEQDWSRTGARYRIY